MNNKTSIVTVTYNSSRNIQKLLDSLVTSSRWIDEVIIIENNSPDKHETKRICESYAKKIKLRYISSKNVGFGRSCNLGASICTSDSILFLNPDTELKENSLEILLRHMAVNGADIIGGKAINYEGKTHGSVVRVPSLFIGLFEFSNLGKIFRINLAHKLFYYEDVQILNSKKDSEVNVVSGAYLLIKRSSFNLLGGFDENIFMYLEDVDLCKRAIDLRMKVLYCPHSRIFHIGGASSNNKYKIRHQAWFDSRKYYFKKHFGFFVNLIIQPLYVVEEFLLKKYRNL